MNDDRDIEISDRTPSPGRYRIVVRDSARRHNWHLYGNGKSIATTVRGTGRWVFKLRLTAGSYRVVCDPHNDDMEFDLIVRLTRASPPTRSVSAPRMRWASSMSSWVIPPAECVDNVMRSVRQRMSMSGWWSICSASTAIASTAAMASEEGRELQAGVQALPVAGPTGKVGQLSVDLLCVEQSGLMTPAHPRGCAAAGSPATGGEAWLSASSIDAVLPSAR